MYFFYASFLKCHSCKKCGLKFVHLHLYVYIFFSDGPPEARAPIFPPLAKLTTTSVPKTAADIVNIMQRRRKAKTTWLRAKTSGSTVEKTTFFRTVADRMWSRCPDWRRRAKPAFKTRLKKTQKKIRYTPCYLPFKLWSHLKGVFFDMTKLFENFACGGERVLNLSASAILLLLCRWTSALKTILSA